MAAGQALTGVSANPMANATSATKGASAMNAASGTSATASTDSSSDSSSDSATISANDFLSLLVTEMQNQDPTADTDPNEYINQLVQVNSLEQLIDINQNLSTALGSPAPGSGAQNGVRPASGATSAVTAPNRTTSASQVQAAMQKGGGLAATSAAASGAPTGNPAATFAARLKHAPGNLAVPEAKPASRQVAHALDGHSHAQSIAGRLPDAR